MPRYGVRMAVVPVHQGLGVCLIQDQGHIHEDSLAALGLGLVPDAY